MCAHCISLGVQKMDAKDCLLVLGGLVRVVKKEPAMSEFEGKSGKWAWEIQKEQQANLDELRSSIENLVQKYKHDAHASSLFGDQDKARVYNCFANQLKNLLKGGA